MSCKQIENKVSDNFININKQANTFIVQDTINYKIKLNKEEIPQFIMKYHDSTINYMMALKNSNLPFENDSSFEVKETLASSLYCEWNIFLIKGVLSPSQADYFFYGIYNKQKIYVHDFFSAPVEVNLQLDSYSCDKNYINIYGLAWDDSGIDDGSKPPVNRQLLMSYYME